MSAPLIIDNSSSGACHNGLDVFDIPATNVSVNKSEYRIILPMNTIDEQPYEFRVFSDNQWIDLSETYLYTQLGIEKFDPIVGKWVANSGNATNLDQHVGFVQSPGQSVVRQLKIHMNNVEVYDSTNGYPYLSYIKNELTLSNDVKDTLLSATGYYRENEMDNKNDKGFKNRAKLTAGGKVCELMSRLDFDLANQNRFLLNNIDLVFTIYRSDDAFLIQNLSGDTTTQYRVKVHAIKLLVKTIDVQPAVNIGILKALRSKNEARYPMRKMDFRSCYVSPGRREITQNLFSNTVPRRIIVGLVDHSAYAGDSSKSPFNFQNYKLRDIVVNAGGLSYPAVNYNMSFGNDDVVAVRPFLDFHKQCNSLHNNSTNGITYEKWLNGWSFFIISLTSTLDDCGGFDLVRTGTTSIHLRFNTPIENPGMTMIAVGEFDHILSIDENRIVMTDGSIS